MLAYYVDVAGMQRESQSGRSSIGVDERGRDGGERAKTMGVEDGIGEDMRDVGREGGGADVPRLLVHPRCRGVILGMQSYARGKDREVVKDGVHDHLMDAMRYGLVGHGRGVWEGGGEGVLRRSQRTAVRRQKREGMKRGVLRPFLIGGGGGGRGWRAKRWRGVRWRRVQVRRRRLD